MRRRRNVILVIGLLLAVGVVSAGVVLWRAIHPFDRRAFAPNVWATGSPESRAAMAGDAVRRVTPGMTEPQVVALLGKPGGVVSANGGAGGHHVAGVRAYTYYIGSWSLHGMDDAFLFVHLDASDRVIKADIYGY